MPYRKAILMGFSAFLVVLAVDPGSAGRPVAFHEPTAQEVEAAVLHAALAAGLSDASR